MGRNAHDVMFIITIIFVLIGTVINADRSNLKLKYTLRIFFPSEQRGSDLAASLQLVETCSKHETSGSHGVECEDDSCVGYSAV
jgi:hypothetical protein